VHIRLLDYGGQGFLGGTARLQKPWKVGGAPGIPWSWHHARTSGANRGYRRVGSGTAETGREALRSGDKRANRPQKIWLGWKDYSARTGLTPSGPPAGRSTDR
jgi:hypothetical protein